MKSSFPPVFANFCSCGRFAQGKKTRTAGVALVITLSVVVLLTIVVVAFATTTQLERASSRSNFEQKRAQSLSMLAVDEVIGKLRDNIPTDGQWAVGPGELYCTKTPNVSTPVTVDLHSGKATGSSTGSIALNRPSLTAPTDYPVVPQNTDYINPDPMQIAWINVLQDGTRSTDPGYATLLNLTSNPIVGRYAYWTDVETGKANINTAGYAATGPVQLTVDNQLYFSQPSRVDLSLLDPGTSGIPVVTRTNSVDTFVYNSGAKPAGGGRYNPCYDPAATSFNSPALPAAKFSSIEDWVRTPSANTGTATSAGTLSGIVAAQVAANRFYLTTQSRTPELTPWGLNRVWWSDYPPGTTTTANSGPGDRSNSPSYSPAISTGYPTHPITPETRYNNEYPDNRYYVYPWVARDWDNYTLTAQAATAYPVAANATTHPFQNFGVVNGSQFATSRTDDSLYSFFTNLYNQLARRDWPGMPSVSFVDKYGQSACENIVANIMFMADAALGSPDGIAQKCMNFQRAIVYADPNIYNLPQFKSLNRDTRGCYGLFLLQSPIPHPASHPTPHYLWGKGNWPYVNKVMVDFVASGTGATKSATTPGFCPAIITSTDKTHLNVLMNPYVELVWPPGVSQHNVTGRTTPGANRFSLNNGGNSGINVALSQIGVTATGTYNGMPATYPTAAAPSNYSWYYPDDVTGVQASGWLLPRIGNTTAPFLAPTGSTPTYQHNPSTNNITVGPFDKNMPVKVTLTFRVSTSTWNSVADLIPLQVIPCYPADLSKPNGTDITQVFSFTYQVDNLTDPSATMKATKGYECIDPRVYQDIADWKYLDPLPANDIGARNSIYVSTNTSPGSSYPNLDDSKFAFPDQDLILDQDTTGTDILPQFQSQADGNPNRYQSATSVTGMAGTGWLSLISTADDAQSAQNPNPMTTQAWKTLDFGPNGDANNLPDWLMLELFAVPYDQSFVSQTSGKINLNSRVYPSGFDRTRPMAALIGNGTSNNVSITTAAGLSLAKAIAARTYSSSGVDFNATNFTGMKPYLYPGEICQIAGVADDPSRNQFAREALVRDIAGLVTTQSSDFVVHLVSQAVKQLSNTGNPVTDLKVVFESRGDAYLERTPDLGPDGIPGTSDDLYGADGVKGINSATSLNDDLNLKTASGTPATITAGQLNYVVTGSSADSMLEGGASKPPFHYRLTKLIPLTK